MRPFDLLLAINRADLSGYRELARGILAMYCSLYPNEPQPPKAKP